MQRFFIADIHLNENEPVITTGFLRFLKQLPNDCELYILGDLFDYWIGDDVSSPLHQTVAKALRELAVSNIKTYFIQGNRDFLLGKQYTKQCQMVLLPEIDVLTNSFQRIVILHGDLLCTDDKAYQKFRKKMHSKWLQKLFLLLPGCLRHKIANKLRGESQQHNRHKSEYIMDVNQQSVEAMMKQHQADIMIHGHTHKPATHCFEINDKPVKRIVLGAWHDGISYIHQDELGKIELIKNPLEP